MQEFDIAIIGGGPIGLACGIEAKEKGFSYVILEKGCLVNSLYNYPANMTFFSTSDRLEIGNIPFTSLQFKPTRSEALEYYRRVTQWFDLNIRLFEKVVSVQKQEGHFEITSEKTQYKTRYVIVATGFYDIPNKMGIPGEELTKVTHYYKDPHYYAFQHVVVVGGNNSAVDAALETYRKGAHVTMVMMEEDVGERVKYWVRPDVVNRIAEGSIKAFTSSKLKEIRSREVDVLTPDGLITIPNDFVIAMTGYRPNFELLQSMGVTLSEDGRYLPMYDPLSMETNIPGLFLAGVVVGGMETHLWFIENSRIHAGQIMNHLEKLQHDVA